MIKQHYCSFLVAQQ